jgi:NitT/TauT family transport system substrate-binding protein
MRPQKRTAASWKDNGRRTLIRAAMVTLLTAAMLLAACAPQESEQPPDQVTVQLKWIHQAQFAGFYAADQKGFYAEEGIDAILTPGGPHLPPATAIADLVAGEADFAIVGGDQLLAARARGEPAVAIAVIFQRNPYVYASLEGSGIERPQDLVGKKVMVAPGAEIQHQALLRKLGIAPDAIEEIPYQRDVTPLTTGQIDAHMVYRTGTGLAFDETGYELNWTWVEDYGIHLYADTIITREGLIRRDPELVERFLRATLRGWRYAIENQAEAVDLTLQYDSTLTRDRQARMMATQTPLIHTGKTKLGWMDRGVWAGMQDLLNEAGIVAQERIEQKAREVAKQVEEYVKAHPDMTLKDLQDDPSFRDIVIQPIGETGYTSAADANTGLIYFHPRRELENTMSAEAVKEQFPEAWAIVDRAVGPTCQESSGFYLFEDADGKMAEKYVHIACADAETADGKSLHVSAVTYVEEYTSALSEKEIEIDEAFTMQFLNQIYGQAE